MSSQTLHKMAKTFLFVFPLLFLNVYTVVSKICKEPPTAEGYENVKYEGIWYEIGKVINNKIILYYLHCIFPSTYSIPLIPCYLFYFELDPNSRWSLFSTRLGLHYCNIRTIWAHIWKWWHWIFKQKAYPRWSFQQCIR